MSLGNFKSKNVQITRTHE